MEGDNDIQPKQEGKRKKRQNIPSSRVSLGEEGYRASFLSDLWH